MYVSHIRIWLCYNMTLIPILLGALGTINKGLITGPEELKIRVRAETLQTTRPARILRRVMET